MNEDGERQSGANAETKTTGDVKRNERARRIAIYAGVLLAVFLLGLVPMWLTARERAKELGAAQPALRVGRLQNTLANAAVDARREYEPARQSASESFHESARGNRARAKFGFHRRAAGKLASAARGS